MTTILKGNIVSAPACGRLDVMEHGYLIAENGVVSMPVAAKMAKRVRKALGSDIGIGITGWAGPDGDDVGLVFVALASRGGGFVRCLQCGHAPRPRIRLIAASNALDMIRRYLTGLDV